MPHRSRVPALFMLSTLFALLVAALPARAQWAVIDVNAIAQLVRQIQTMQQQLTVAQSQLTQAQTALSTMTGARGMQALLSGVERNYLPTSAAQLFAPPAGAGTYAPFAQAVATTTARNAVLSPTQLATLAPSDQAQLLAARQANAVRQSAAQAALSNASGRFAEIQTLIAAIAQAGDQKGILELQARIVAELSMLQSEQNKLATLSQTLQAQDAVNALRDRETALAAQGQFATRLRPTP